MVDPSIMQFAKSLLGMLAKASAEASVFVATTLWDSLMIFLGQYWIQVSLIISVIFIILFIQAKLGRWGGLGSYLYNIFYFGILFLIGLIFGPRIFANDTFNTITAIVLYPVCFWLSGRAMVKLDVLQRA